MYFIFMPLMGRGLKGNCQSAAAARSITTLYQRSDKMLLASPPLNVTTPERNRISGERGGGGDRIFKKIYTPDGLFSNFDCFSFLKHH